MVFFLKMLIEDSSILVADGTGNHMDRQIRIQQQPCGFLHTNITDIRGKGNAHVFAEDIRQIVAVVIHCSSKFTSCNFSAILMNVGQHIMVYAFLFCNISSAHTGVAIGVLHVGEKTFQIPNHNVLVTSMPLQKLIKQF